MTASHDTAELHLRMRVGCGLRAALRSIMVRPSDFKKDFKRRPLLFQCNKKAPWLKGTLALAIHCLTTQFNPDMIITRVLSPSCLPRLALGLISGRRISRAPIQNRGVAMSAADASPPTAPEERSISEALADVRARMRAATPASAQDSQQVWQRLTNGAVICSALCC